MAEQIALDSALTEGDGAFVLMLSYWRQTIGSVWAAAVRRKMYLIIVMI